MEFRNNINKGKNGPEYLLKKRELCCTINEEYNQGVTTLLPKARHLIYVYYKKNTFPNEIWPTTRLDQINPIGEERICERYTAGHAATAKNQ